MPYGYEINGEKDTRSGFGDAMTELGQQNPNVVALCADLTGSLKLGNFQNENPDRFIQCGISEANMIGLAAGLATGGKIPFATTFANFATSRVYDQVRQSVAYSQKNVKIAASHAGVTLGEDGATHQVLEDIGMMKMLPHMTVVVPCDYTQTYQATKAVAAHQGPVYLRFGRPKWPVFIPEDMPFEIGRAQLLKEGTDLTIIACGHLVWLSILAAEVLQNEHNISAEVINMHTIKPLDEEAILESVKKTGAVVTAEEHQQNGGLGESVAGVLSRHLPAPQEFVAMQDQFGESGKPLELLQKYGMSTDAVVQKSLKVLKRKA